MVGSLSEGGAIISASADGSHDSPESVSFSLLPPGGSIYLAPHKTRGLWQVTGSPTFSVRPR